MKKLIAFLFCCLLIFNIFGQTTITQKTCGRCGGIVSNSAKVGDKCPHCGVIWGKENTKTTTNYNNYTRPSSSYSSSKYNSSSNYSTPKSTNSYTPSRFIGFYDAKTICKTNLKASPDNNSNTLKVLPQGTKISVTHQNGSWYYVRYMYLVKDPYYNYNGIYPGYRNETIYGYVHGNSISF